MDEAPRIAAGLWVRKHAAPALAVAATLLLALLKLSRSPALTWGQVLMPLWVPPAVMIVIWALGMLEARLVCVFQDTFFPRPSAIERSDA